MYERGKKHVSEFIAGLPSNFSVIHNKVHHGGSNQMNFRMEAVKKFISPLDRQIDESLRIHYTEVDRKEGSDVVVMNSMSEWRNNKILGLLLQTKKLLLHHRCCILMKRPTKDDREEEGGHQEMFLYNLCEYTNLSRT